MKTNEGLAADGTQHDWLDTTGSAEAIGEFPFMPKSARKGENGEVISSVIIADDHRLVANGIARLLDPVPDFKVVQICYNGDELSATLNVICPDLLLLDIDMPGLSILSFLRGLDRRKPAPIVLVLSGLAPDIYAGRVVDAGAAGFVSKDVSPSGLLTAMRSVRDGQLWIHRDQARKQGRKRGRESGAQDPLSYLSSRELEVFRLLGRAVSSADIAELLGISPRTVGSHRARIYKKLSISNASELIRLAAAFDQMDNTP